jgi:Tfp pilus assembly protein PilE
MSNPMNPSGPLPAGATDPQPGPEPALPPTPPKKRRYGVVEWASIIAILALLAAIAIPNFVKARTTACKNACIPNLKQIDGAIQQWALENKKAGTATVTLTDILPFLKGSALPICPAAGTYVLSTVSATPRCTQSANGHSV